MSGKTHAYIYSTLTASNVYREYKAGGGDMPIVGRSVTILGGSNIPNKQLITPHGAVTKIDATDLEWLMQEETFLLHLKNGFLKISEAETDPEKVAADMEGRDVSAPLVEEDFEEGQAPVGASEEDKPTTKKNNRRA